MVFCMLIALRPAKQCRNPGAVLRAGLTYWFIASGHGLVALALITLITSTGALIAKTILALQLEPGLRVRFSLITRESAQGLFGYGIQYFPFALIRSLAPQITATMIGSLLGTALVTPFSIATRLLGFANSFLLAGTGLLTPVATAMHARDDHDRQRALFIAGGRGCLALTLLFATLFVLLGEPLIRLWMGPSLVFTFPLLLILTAGELLPMAQQITLSIIQGKGRIAILTASSFLELCASTALTVLLIDEYGLQGVCVAVAVPAAFCRGLWPLVYACRSVGVPLGHLYWPGDSPCHPGCIRARLAACPDLALVDPGHLARTAILWRRLFNRLHWHHRRWPFRYPGLA